MKKEEEILGKESLLQMIDISKERSEEYDSEIVNQWKEARSNFFNHAIQQKVSQTKTLQQCQTEIVQIFLQAKQDIRPPKLNIYLYKKEEFYEKNHHIGQLNQSLKFINQQFSRRQKENPEITQIIQLKLTELRVISIQYSLNINQQHRYQVSAFELFKIVHQNKGLSSVTLKGVLVKFFKEFIRAKAQSNFSQIQENKELNWMKNFKPSKSLKLVIDPQDDFCLANNEDHLVLMKDLVQFGGMFLQLSGISVKIALEEYKYLAKMENNLYLLQQQLRMIGRIKIKIEGQYRCDYADFPFFVQILQMLSSLTNIAQLQFKYITLNPQFGINYFLAMEQMLSTSFENNAVTHLKLYNCYNFPLFPAIHTLQTIALWNMSFRRQYSFMSELANSRRSLQSIKYAYMRQEWRIEEQLFNKLQSLYIGCNYFIKLECQNAILGVLTHSPSNIKHLTIHKSKAGNVDCLSVLFPKLAHTTQFSQLMCTIPSPHLAVLAIHVNNQFEAKDLEAIDKKWPKLRQLTLRDCPNLKESGWSTCEFKGLIKLSIDTQILTLGHSIRQQLRGRGIVVY